jgi:predicted Zn-dependent protease
MAEGYNWVLQGRVDSGLESLQIALTQSQGKPEASLARLTYALGLHKAGKAEEAIREFKLLKSDAPDIANVWLTVFNVK